MLAPLPSRGRAWYEHRKAALLLAALPQAQYLRAFEPGCADGELSVGLALRCDQVVCADRLATRAACAQRRLQALPHVRVFCRAVPAWWPRGRFDLIVISDIACGLDDAALDLLAERIEASLLPHGTLLLCHARRIRHGAWRNGDAVFRRVDRRLRLGRLGGWMDDDMRIDLWRGEGQSVAAVETP